MDLKISELPELSALNNDDYLVLQRDTSGKQSYKIKFSDFKEHFLNRFNQIGIGSAARCNASQFAPFAHGHDYTDLWYFPSYGPSSFNVEEKNKSKLCCVCDGYFSIMKYGPGVDNELSSPYTLSVWQPPGNPEIKNELTAYRRYKVGDLQCLAVNNFYQYLTEYRGYEIVDGNINVTADTFDGFVVPNGQTIRCAASQFKSACKMYAEGNNPNATSFTLPNLTDTFFKCDPGLPASEMTPLSSVPYNNAVLAHNHNDILISNAKSVNINLKNVQFHVRTTQTGSQFQNSVHGANGNSKKVNSTSDYKGKDVYPSITKVNLSCNVKDITCAEAGEDAESYPDYIGIQMLLYIGKIDE